MHPFSLQVRWVPGTSNRLIVRNQSTEKEVFLHTFEDVCGKEATFDLYLQGKTTLQLSGKEMKRLGV